MSGALIDNNEELMKLSSEIKVEQEQLVSGSVLIDTNDLDRNYIFSVNDKTMVLNTMLFGCIQQNNLYSRRERN